MTLPSLNRTSAHQTSSLRARILQLGTSSTFLCCCSPQFFAACPRSAKSTPCPQPARQVLARDKRSLGGHPGALSLAARPGRSLSGMARGVGHRISLDLLRSHPRPRRSVELAHMREEAPQEEVQLPGQHHTLQQQQQLQPGSSGLGAGMVVVGSAEPGTGTGTDAGGSLTGDEEGSRHAGGKGRAVGRVGGSGGSPAGSGGGAGRENNSRLANWVRQSLANVHGPGTWLSGSPLRGGGGARGSRGGALQRQSTSQEVRGRRGARGDAGCKRGVASDDESSAASVRSCARARRVAP